MKANFLSTTVQSAEVNDFARGAHADFRAQKQTFVRRAAAYLARPWLQCLLLAVGGFIVRMPALQGQPVWDDHYLTHDNPLMKSPLLVLEVFRHSLFLDSFSTHYRPVQNLSFIFDYFFWGTNPYGFHLTNILLHVGSGVLLCNLLRRLIAPWCGAGGENSGNNSRASLLAFTIASLWVVHPVHSGAVDYISGRADSLSLLFATAAWLLALLAHESRRRSVIVVLYSSAAFSGLLALCSREIAGVWLALFLLHVCCFQSEARRGFKLASVVGCVCLLGFYVGLRHLPRDHMDPPPSTGWKAPMRAVLMLRALGDYGRLIVYPAHLHMERSVLEPANYRSSQSWKESATAEYLSVGGLAILAAFAAGSLPRGEGATIRLFGAAWFAMAYLPVSNLIELNATVAEHWLYLPSVGFLIFVAGCAVDLPARYRRAGGALACVAIACLSLRSAARSSDWVNEQTFYERTLAAGGTTVRVAVNLAQIYVRQGELTKAEIMFRKVLRITPDYPFARNGLGQVLYQEGKINEAQTLLADSTNAAPEARKDYPRTWLAALSLARVERDRGDAAGALAVLERAHRDYPQAWEIISFEAELIRGSAGPAAALLLIEDFAKKNWWHYGASLALGRLYAEEGDSERAEGALRHASWLDVRDAEALNLIAAMQVRQNRLADACRVQRRAVSRQPDEPRQYLILSDILGRMGRGEEARLATAQFAHLQSLAQNQTAVN
ncbi:MAG: tetratricopeptide repeat protein [Chthoniobacterales bacterium]